MGLTRGWTVDGLWSVEDPWIPDDGLDSGLECGPCDWLHLEDYTQTTQGGKNGLDRTRTADWTGPWTVDQDMGRPHSLKSFFPAK